MLYAGADTGFIKGGRGWGGEKDTHVLLNQQGLPQKCFDLEIGT